MMWTNLSRSFSFVSSKISSGQRRSTYFCLGFFLFFFVMLFRKQRLSISSQCNYYVCTRVIIMTIIIIIIIIILSPVFLSLSRRRTLFSPPPFRPIVVRSLDALGGAVSREIDGGGDGGFADVGKTWDGVDKRWE